VVNLNQVPASSTFGAAGGPPRPAVPFRETDFWAGSLSCGVEVRY
jgi:hypothetical protein